MLINVPRLPRNTIALALLAVAALPNGCRVLPTALPPRIETQQLQVSHVGRGRKPAPGESVSEVRYTPNPYFGHARTISVVTTGRRAWFTVTFDRPFRGRLGTDFIASAFVASPDSGEVMRIVTEGAHRCNAYRLVWKQSPDGTVMKTPEFAGTSSARIDKERLVLGFTSDLLPVQQSYRMVILKNPNLNPFASPFGQWLDQVLGHVRTEPVAIRSMSEYLSESPVH